MSPLARTLAAALPVAFALAIGLGGAALLAPASGGAAVAASLAPAVIPIGLALALAAAGAGARGIAGGLGAGLGIGALVLFHPSRLVLAEGALPDWAAGLRDCALMASAHTAPFRMIWWSVDGAPNESALFALLDAQPDVVILHGLTDPALLDALGQELPGETLWLDAEDAGGPTGIAVRGSFQFCGGQEDRWLLDLPGARAGAAVLLPQLREEALLPLVILHGPRSPLDGGGRRFADDTETAVAALRALSLQVGARKMLVVGDLGAPRPFLDGALDGVGLAEVPLPPTWPARLALWPEGRLWRGDGWVVRDLVRMAPLGSASAPLLLEFAPR